MNVVMLQFWRNLSGSVGSQRTVKRNIGTLTARRFRAESGANPVSFDVAGCFYKSERYEHGDVVSTPEPCLNCTCQKGVLVCYLRVCPTTGTPAPGCFTAREAGECCPNVFCSGEEELRAGADVTGVQSLRRLGRNPSKANRARFENATQRCAKLSSPSFPTQQTCIAGNCSQ